MPQRKTYPPASRRSERLTSEPTDVPLPSSGNEEVPTNDPDRQEGGPLQPNEMMAGQSDLLARLAALEAENERLRAVTPGLNDGRRAATPADSAFGGTKFTPIGMAADKAFQPYGSDQETKNPDYSDKAKNRAENPGKFNGDQEEFDGWVRRVADKFLEDNSIFRTERSRMAFLMTQLEGEPLRSIEVRYQSPTDPFSCVAEMVQVLEAAYHDPNQASTARAELSRLRYAPGEKANIHRFIAQFNTLAQKAEIPKSSWKTLLWEHIPSYLNHQLLEDSKDPCISYEAFCNKVANSAYSYQRGYELRQENNHRKKEKAAHNDRSNRTRKTDQKTSGEGQPRKPIASKANHAKPVTSREVRRALTQDEKKVHWDAGTCFICGEADHESTECPDRKATTSVKALGAREPTKDEAKGLASSDSESGKE